MIHTLKSQGLSVSEIARQLKVDRKDGAQIPAFQCRRSVGHATKTQNAQARGLRAVSAGARPSVSDPHRNATDARDSGTRLRWQLHHFVGLPSPGAAARRGRVRSAF